MYWRILHKRRKINPLTALITTTVLLGLSLVAATEISCRVYGDPYPHAMYQIGYETGPMVDATAAQTCRINTRKYWMHRVEGWFGDISTSWLRS